MTFLEFARGHGLIINRIESRRWVRCSTEDKPRKQNGSYFHDGDYASLINWATMSDHVSWFAGKPSTPREMEEMSKRMAASRKMQGDEVVEKRAAAAKKAELILSHCQLDLSMYLSSKGFPEMPGNMLFRDDLPPLLCIPMYYRERICGVQTIDPDGVKKFLLGQRSQDAYFKIGSGKDVFLVEGFASALSLQVALDAIKIKYTILVCFSAGNMSRLAKAHPGAMLICDNDVSGTGQRVGADSGCKWWMSEALGEDINEYHRRVGKFTMSQTIGKFIRGALK